MPGFILAAVAPGYVSRSVVLSAVVVGTGNSGEETVNAQHPESFSMAELVERSGVPASTVHHYLRRGLLPEPVRVAPKRFLYGPGHVDALRVIRGLRERQLLPLSKIGEMLPDILDNLASGSEHDTESVLEGRRRPAVAERILDVAIEAFGLHSYGEVSVADLCAGAGVAKGTFYRHFDSKSEVFLRATERVVLQALELFRSRVGELDEPVQMRAAAELCAAALRPGLPILLELAKRAMLFEPEYVMEARDTFRLLAEELGMILQPDDAGESYVTGGMVILDAVVQVFRQLVGGRHESTRPPA